VGVERVTEDGRTLGRVAVRLVRLDDEIGRLDAEGEAIARAQQYNDANNQGPGGGDWSPTGDEATRFRWRARPVALVRTNRPVSRLAPVDVAGNQPEGGVKHGAPMLCLEVGPDPETQTTGGTS
jgi:hypothetical protein